MKKNNQSVAKALQIIEIMASGNGPMRLQDISARLKLPASTVLRFLGTLNEYNYVSQDPETLQYGLTMKFCRLGHLVSSQVRMRDIVRPYLLSLSDKFKESASLAVEEEQNVLYVDCVDGPDHMLQTLQRIGRVAPLNATGVGKILLVNYSAADVDRLIKTRGLDAPTKNTITKREPLMRELKKIQKAGYALDNEECEIGVRCVAAPLRDFTGNVAAAISMSGPVSRMTPEKISAIREGLTRASREISTELGFVSTESQTHTGKRVAKRAPAASG